jgi:VWFA-related protein
MALLPLLAAAASLTAVQERKPPEFRTDVRMIRLDVSAVDGRGRPVAGLGPEDFVVTEDGRPVEITFFEAVTPPPDDVVEPSPALMGQPPRRRVLLLVDSGAMGPGQLLRTRDSVASYLRDATTEGDWVRLVDLSTARVWDGWIPEDRERLEAAAGALVHRHDLWARADGFDAPIQDRFEVDAVPGAPSETETAGQFLSVFAQASGLLGSLESLLVQLGGVEGRKALVLVSPGFPQLRDLDRRLERVATLAREAATAIYFVDAMGLDGLLPEPGRRMRPAFESAWARSGGAQDLAAATGGFTSRFANSLLPALSRVAAEMRTYYVIGYQPTRPDDGRFRSVKVRVAVRGVTARTKKGYLAVPAR